VSVWNTWGCEGIAGNRTSNISVEVCGPIFNRNVTSVNGTIEEFAGTYVVSSK
jgi:hypothetical protein